MATDGRAPVWTRRDVVINRATQRRAGVVAKGLAERISTTSARSWAFVLAVTALLVRLPLLFTDHRVTPGGDSAGYIALAQSLAEGNGLDDVYRTPGYPAFIFALDLFPWQLEDTVVITQHLIAVALVALLVLVVWQYLGRGTAILAGGMLALTPAGPYLEHAILSDFLFSVLVFLVAVVLGRALLEDPPHLRALIAAGALCALAAYVRPTGQFLVLAPLLATPLVTRDLRQTARVTVVVAATFGLLVAPWVIRNATKFDTTSMSAVTGNTLFVRAFEVDRLPIPRDTPTGAVANEAAATRGDTRLVTAVTRALQERGIDQISTLKAQQALAQSAIWGHPWTYALGTVRETSDLRLDIREVDPASDVGPHLPSPPEYTQTVWDAASAFSAIWWILSLHMFAGVCVLFAPVRETRIVGTTMLAVWMAVAVGTALGRGALTRYSLELAPLSLVLGSFGAVLVATSVMGLVRGWRQGSTAASSVD